MESSINNNSSEAKWYDFNKKTIVDIIGALYILLFIYAAVSKLMEYQKFELQISKTPIITDFANILVWLVPTLEIIISLLLMFPKTVIAGLYGALGLMTLFTIYIYAILNFSETIPCSCGGVLQAMSWSQHLAFNIVFVMLAIVAILIYTKQKTAIRS